jgi:Family of unknown function (DUF6496)
MPYTEVMHKFKHGLLHSGSDKGPKVKNRKQAIAIMLSEKRAAAHGKKEYQAPHKGIGPSHEAEEDMMKKKKKH